jgi:N-ethylmaleimide reductase
MTVEDIKTTVKDFQNAAMNAVKAGFDGVEIHSSNGYLFQQSLTEQLIIERINTAEVLKTKRIFFEVLDAVKEVIPEEKIGARFNPSLHGPFGTTMDEETIPTFEYIIKKIKRL